MIKRKLIIQNRYGLHARPAAQFVQIASQYDADIKIKKDEIEVNGKSIMGILMLAVEKGSEVELTVSGKDEKEAMDALAGFLLNTQD
ncbi:phosphocarrier protein HPr [candidate division KSB1 bacterium]|nr:MAG: phosphocarrier protein HPr [candidate division KSB1 bacterium]